MSDNSNNGSTGPLQVHDGHSFKLNNTSNLCYEINANGEIHYHMPSIDEIERLEEHARQKTLKDAELKVKMESLATIFPRGYEPITDFHMMLEIARADLMNPLYESVLQEFDDASSRLHNAANKLACAVKMTDSDIITQRNEEAHIQATQQLYVNYARPTAPPTANASASAILNRIRMQSLATPPTPEPIPEVIPENFLTRVKNWLNG